MEMIEKDQKPPEKGFVLIAIVVAIAILMMLYAVQMRGIFGPSLPSQPSGIEDHPWLLEELLIAEGSAIALPRSPKVLLDKPHTLSGAVKRDDASRGTVTIRLHTDGRVEADWLAEYAHGSTQYRLDAAMKGNIDVRQTYQDANGKDKRRLFFIAQGAYRQQTRDPQSGQSQESGAVWLLGYVTPDGRAEGTLTLTTDRQWSAVYRYSVQQQRPQ